MAGRPNNPAAIAGHIQGLREAKAAFQALEPTFREHLADATETTVREIARGAQARLRSSPSIQTRNLHNAVGWTLNRKNGRGRAGVQNITTTVMVKTSRVDRITGKTHEGFRRQRVKGIVSADQRSVDRPSRRAHFIEFGTRHQPAEPFMIPAAAAEQAHYLERVRDASKKAERDLAAIGSRNV